MEALGVPIQLSNTDRDAMKIKDIIERARILDQEKNIHAEKLKQDKIDGEFEELYKFIINKIKQTNSVKIRLTCFLKHHKQVDELKQKLNARFIVDDALPHAKEIIVQNEIDELIYQRCVAQSILCCCIPLPYWSYFFVQNLCRGDQHTIWIFF
jgi:hypothetical protein